VTLDRKGRNTGDHSGILSISVSQKIACLAGNPLFQAEPHQPAVHFAGRLDPGNDFLTDVAAL
jgi:hypothetical protein